MANNKQIENKVSVLGEVKELFVSDLKTKNGVPMKIANYSIQTGEGEVHRVTQMAVEYFEKDGKKEENRTYKAIQTLENEIVTIQDISEGKAEGTPTVVRANGSLEINMFKTKAGVFSEQAQINGRFVNRVTDAKPKDFGVEFTLQAFAMTKGIRVTDNNGDDTDKVKFKAATISYDGQAHPFEFTADDEYGVASWLEDDLENGMTLTLSGKVFNKYNVKTVERKAEGGVGKPIVDTVREIERGIIVEGIIPIEDEENPKFFTADEITKSIKKYEAKKVEVESSKPKETKTEVKKGVQKATPTASPTASKPVVKSEDLPF
ncbi:hypothetical protein [Mammaliicoccus sciuri]|uniref:hypothetical protein n=1 Tax=Mammaliicoccus sciuri TaxID=1296 RepID=UPI002DB92258|nr:hypothetical protein [Mammaliicoccus sciuri]MEB6232576.1 hypothetical protein [Mammaliicoccus sciuri]